MEKMKEEICAHDQKKELVEAVATLSYAHQKELRENENVEPEVPYKQEPENL